MPGVAYDFGMKMRVASIYVESLMELYPREPTIKFVAEEAKVGWDFARRVISEIQDTGTVIDPGVTCNELMSNRKVSDYLSKQEEVYLLALRAEKPIRSNLSYVDELFNSYGKRVSSAFISNFSIRDMDTLEDSRCLT